MRELFATDGTPIEAHFELVDASGPVAPRFAHATTIRVSATRAGVSATRDHRDAAGAVHDTRSLSREEYTGLVGGVLAVVPLGVHLDLVGDKAHAKGVSFNHVKCELAGEIGRLDYLSSHADAEDGDERVVAALAAFRALFS